MFLKLGFKKELKIDENLCRMLSLICVFQELLNTYFPEYAVDETF